MMLNAYWGPLDFMLPAAGIDNGSGWRRWIDTAQETPNDIVAWQDAPPVPGASYRVEPRSVVVLFAHGH
jgi:glycogen operon protein